VGVPIAADDDIVRVRQRVRAWAVGLGFSLVDQTKLVTAASELARNTLVYGQGGTLLMESVLNDSRRGLRLTFEDHGPGIPDINLALKDGSTGNGLARLSSCRSQDFRSARGGQHASSADLKRRQSSRLPSDGRAAARRRAAQRAASRFR
jgi:serine/threonine-protein kinase RsbT